MQDMLSFPAKEAEQIIAAHDGDVALLWLCLRRNPDAGVEDAAGMLCRTRAEMEAALEKLQRMGLAEPTVSAPAAAAPAQTAKLPPADETPQYTARDLAERSKEDPRFAALVIEAQRALGHVLNTNDLKRLFSLYDYLALPPEVIMMLLNYCVKSRPTGNPPSMRQIEKEGYVWANREILTFEQAEKYIADSEHRREKLAQTARLLGITGRALSPTESRYIGEWLEMGFDMEMLREAFDRTVTNTGKRAWSYMNTIMESWRDKGIFSPKDIQEKDRPAASRKTKPSRPAGEQKSKKDSLEKIMKKLDRERGDST